MTRKTSPVRSLRLHMEIQHFELPPIRDVLLVGKNTPIGPKAIYRALEELTPGIFELIFVEHNHIEALIIRKTHLRKIDKDHLVRLLIQETENILDDTDTLHVKLDLTIETFREELLG